MLSVEFAEPHRTTCECCGKATTRLTRYVSRDGEAYAVYYASFGEEHPQVKAVVSLGIWWEGGTPADRVAFPMVLWEGEDSFGVRLVDAEESPWKSVALLGRMLKPRRSACPSSREGSLPCQRPHGGRGSGDRRVLRAPARG